MTLREALLFMRLLGWSLVLPLLKRVLPLPALVRLMRGACLSVEPDDAAGERLAVLVRRVLRLRGGDPNCLERSLLLFRYLERTGLEPHLVVGFKLDTDRSPVGHAWIVVDGKPFHDEDASAEYGTPLWFGPDGLRRPAGVLAAPDS